MQKFSSLVHLKDWEKQIPNDLQLGYYIFSPLYYAFTDYHIVR